VKKNNSKSSVIAGLTRNLLKLITKRQSTMEADKADTMKEQPEDVVFFAPSDDIKTIHNVISNLETTQRELKKVVEGMKPVES